MTAEIIKKADAVMAATYTRPPIVFEKGEGSTLRDTQGKSYTDFIAGIAVCNLGHAHPGITKALAEQAGKLFHTSNLYYTLPQTELADWLVRHSFADRAFFCNSGAEANEAAIKLARRYFYEKGVSGRYRIITALKSFHGRTMGTLSATGQDKIKTGFSPILEGFSFVPFNDFAALEKETDESVAAVLLEPIQGEGGVICPAPDYLQKVRGLCSEKGILLILDEIQTGIGRTGKLFAYEHFGIKPDIMTLAKALGNGLPIGAMLAKEEVMSAFGPGAHASTFGGTPVITAAALETLRILTEEGVMEKGAETGAYFREKLTELKEKHDSAVEIRGKGLLLAMELNTEGAPLVQKCLEKGFLINCIQGNVLRFAPPLIIKKEEIDALIAFLDEIL
ncbi:MAG: acetylornithine transaminase [Desulfococcaceae bacterium]|jgi:acetylornithine aminotransferase|nr:acetylornithine transaminase [Desulfococcaceae bacterium]